MRKTNTHCLASRERREPKAQMTVRGPQAPVFPQAGPRRRPEAAAQGELSKQLTELAATVPADECDVNLRIAYRYKLAQRRSLCSLEAAATQRGPDCSGRKRRTD
jgi:hypothetical protein